MSEYTPDRWVMLEITGADNQPIRKIFAGWYGNFFQGNSWRLNSGIVATRIDDQGHYEFDGQSGSVYYCHVNNYGMSGYMSQVLESWRKNMPDTQIKEIELESIAES
jgi:hypothetical protein